MSISRRKLIFLYILVVVIWGTTWMAIKVSVADLPPFLSASIRFFCAAFLLWIVAKFRHQKIKWTSKAMKLYLMVGVGNYFIGYGFTYWGAVYIYSSVTAILWATMPLMVSVFAHWMIPGERLSIWRMGGILVSTGGTILIVSGQWQTLDVSAVKGIILVMISIFGGAFSNVYYKKHVASDSALILNMAGMLIGGALLLVVSSLAEPWGLEQFTVPAIWALVYLAVFGSAVAFTLYFWMFRHLSVVTMSYTTFFIPIIAALVGWFALGEALSWRTILGGVFILAGVAIADFRISKKQLEMVNVAPTPL